ncbi:MAG: hypothetical protein RJB22_2227 [Pseudomonadota bacterium]|jgi:ElaB/YqjD/DUF883 family membrane-anchored ribosome-binding protein
MGKAMTSRDDAARQLQEARARFYATLAVAKQELAPANLTRKTSQKLTQNAKDTVRARPGTAAILAGLLLAFLFRKPIAGLIRHLLREKRHDG